MQTPSIVRLSARNGVEVWRLLTNGVEQFAVTYGHRRARTVGSLAAAEALSSQHIRQAELARAH